MPCGQIDNLIVLRAVLRVSRQPVELPGVSSCQSGCLCLINKSDNPGQTRHAYEKSEWEQETIEDNKPFRQEGYLTRFIYGDRLSESAFPVIQDQR
jgi:hypothetical protein